MAAATRRLASPRFEQLQHSCRKSWWVKEGKGFKYASDGAWIWEALEHRPPVPWGCADALTGNMNYMGDRKGFGKPIDAVSKGYSFAHTRMEIELQAARVFLRQPRGSCDHCHPMQRSSAPWPKTFC